LAIDRLPILEPVSVIRDQRQMSGVQTHDSPQSVRAFWEQYAEGQRGAGKDFQLTRSRKKLVAYVSDSRWVADCRECSGGIALWSENEEACCLDCGTVYSKIDWPSPQETIEAEAVLAARPSDAQRNWRRDQGEGISDLKVENVSRGEPVR
jgi:hypothetical protein